MNPDSPYVGSGSLTREQFLFFEMRTTAKFVVQGLPDSEIVSQIVANNLFQYPTEKSVRQMAKACLARLHALNDDASIAAITNQPAEISKQICLYAIMKHRRLVWDFMITVIGEKYRLKDSSFSRIDMSGFFLRLQEQDDNVASWSDATVQKLKSVLVRILIETEYLDGVKANHLNPVWLNPILKHAIKANGDEIALPAFNCFS